MNDMTCLADGVVVPADFSQTGLNLNEVVVGPTGCGKSFSNAYSRLLYTENSSVVVPIAKGALKKQFSGLFEERGYQVVDLDFSHPERCEIGYDPLDYVISEEDVIHLARSLVGAADSKDKQGNNDPYWNESGASVLAAEIGLVLMNAKKAGRKPCFGDVVDLHRSMKVVESQRDGFHTNLDALFHEAERRFPGNQYCEMWKTICGLAEKTASCIFSVVNSSLDKICSKSVIELTRKKRRVDLRMLGSEKTALFITTSPINKTLQNFVNVLYGDMFRVLFEAAEASENSRLRIPVHIICDDFACGSRIVDFEDYISIFRAAGISVTMLLQSETQLADMYGERAATTIINNCDTYVYMGGMDIETCKNVSLRINKPLNKVLSMPLEHVIVFRRGSEPVEALRYQTLKDSRYQQLLKMTAKKAAGDGRD